MPDSLANGMVSNLPYISGSGPSAYTQGCEWSNRNCSGRGNFMASWVQNMEEQALENTLDDQERARFRFLQRRQAVPAEEGGTELAEGANHLQAASSVGGLPPCYSEIKTLLWIENSVVHKKALEEWERKSNLLTARVERKRKLGLHQRNEIYNQVGFFSVFQGVILTAVSQSNLLHCNNWWSPFLLSVLASIVTCVGVLQKFTYITALDKTISSEETSLKVVVARVNALRRLGKDFRFADSECSRKRKEGSPISKYPTLVFTALFSFAVVFAVSHPIILCYPGCSGACN